MLHMSVARAQSEIGSKEFSEWLAFMRMDHHPDDVRMATICATICNAHGAKNIKPQNFLPRLRKKNQTIDEMKAQLMRAAPSIGAVPKLKKR